ncbi:glutamate--tRNA ligase family protein, partial [Kingella kingae]|nr:glutamate--tRNA ligase family protein [Kingella kingae]
THIVRGQDLLVSTPRQIWLQSSLHLPTPHYAHLPLLTNQHGQKWSKQTLAPALDLTQREQLLRQVMHYLHIPPAPEVNHLADLLMWCIQHWQMRRVSPEAIRTE